MFQVIPAIDVSGGRLAVYAADGPVPVSAFGGDPLVAARAYIAAGARWIHVVDMDLAYSGVLADPPIVGSVAALGVQVQASGGIRDGRTVDRLLAAGASRVVLGSAAFADEEAVRTLVATHGKRLVVGIEVDEGRIRSRGGAGVVDLELAETIGWLTAMGASSFLVTAVQRVGGLQGPDVALVKRLVRSGRPVLAAGGIGGLEDLEAVRRAGASGAVVGRAAMEGELDLTQALARFGAEPGIAGGGT
ncbi:MAG: phosphoribosylformimino-5-aminoimidazole carboxamide ribotide isomerase [Actinomycetota bacterium]|jgi:phosphoribosylformimino-5-aminoimidazole carboxamide ribonucleotide (ProFAR) isomerase|nr:phosphoribosylformimino-5-aminoimidazole carboxamide ribotide isomerase [Actinomycetota bacterium]